MESTPALRPAIDDYGDMGTSHSMRSLIGNSVSRFYGPWSIPLTHAASTANSLAQNWSDGQRKRQSWLVRWPSALRGAIRVISMEYLPSGFDYAQTG